MKKQKFWYCNAKTGDVKNVTERQAMFLPGYNKIEFIKNEEGEHVMRFQFNGATVDIMENKTK